MNLNNKILSISRINLLPYIIFLPTVVTVFFVRGKYYTEISVSMLIPLFSLVGLLYILFVGFVRNYSLYLGGKYIFSFFASSLLFVLIAGIFSSDKPYLNAKFGLEMILNWTIYFIVLNAVLWGVVSERKFLFVILLSSLILSYQTLLTAASLPSISRIGSYVAAPSAANHAGHSLAVALLICFGFIILCLLDKKIFKLWALIIPVTGITISSMLLTGSRAAVLGASSGILVMMWLSLKGRWRMNYLEYYTPLVLLVSMLLYVYNTEVINILGRMTIDKFLESANKRFFLFKNALSELNASSFLFGASERYGEYDTPNKIIYPHNILVSTLVHLGAIPLILLIVDSAKRIFEGVSAINNSIGKRRMYGIIIFSTLFPIFTYSLTSGRMTRIMTIFFVFGLFDAFLSRSNHKKLLSISPR